jgi:PKD repeat protein
VNASSYDVTLMAVNTDGPDTETKTGYVEVTEAVSNQATNIAGRTCTQSDVAIAASQQQLMNYQATTFYPAKQSDIIPRLPNDQIFFFDGHGTQGAIQLNDTMTFPDATLFFGINDVNSFDEASTSYSNMKLAVLLACKAGGTSPAHGNIVDVIAAKGASCVMGWNENIEATDGGSTWSSTFWNRLQDGDDILYAYSEGLGSAEQNYICQNLYSENSTIWDSACNLTRIHFVGNNGGCLQPLTSVLASQMVSANNVKTSIETKFTKISLSSDRKEQILNSISTFARKPDNNIEYKEKIHQSYAELYQVKAGDSSYWVNAHNGRVQTMIVSEKGLKTTSQTIDIDQGLKIAESYVKEKYPELWDTNERKGIRQEIKGINNPESGILFEYSWQEFFINSQLNFSQSLEIPGPNLVTVSVSPYTGKVIHYHEWFSPDNSTLNLTPSLSENDAMYHAESYFQSAGFENINPDQITSSGLRIAIDENNNQHLTWSYELHRNDANNFDKCGYVGIDAHNGEVIWHALIV